jgi:rare lipoprotein A (peptidoglycan hydrolase)
MVVHGDVSGRELDLSAAAFAELAPTSQGVISVRYRVAG